MYIHFVCEVACACHIADSLCRSLDDADLIAELVVLVTIYNIHFSVEVLASLASAGELSESTSDSICFGIELECLQEDRAVCAISGSTEVVREFTLQLMSLRIHSAAEPPTGSSARSCFLSQRVFHHTKFCVIPVGEEHLGKNRIKRHYVSAKQFSHASHIGSKSCAVISLIVITLSCDSLLAHECQLAKFRTQDSSWFRSLWHNEDIISNVESSLLAIEVEHCSCPKNIASGISLRHLAYINDEEVVLNITINTAVELCGFSVSSSITFSVHPHLTGITSPACCVGGSQHTGRTLNLEHWCAFNYSRVFSPNVISGSQSGCISVESLSHVCEFELSRYAAVIRCRILLHGLCELCICSQRHHRRHCCEP